MEKSLLLLDNEFFEFKSQNKTNNILYMCRFKNQKTQRLFFWLILKPSHLIKVFFFFFNETISGAK
jgi:hypothetical protein